MRMQLTRLVSLKLKVVQLCISGLKESPTKVVVGIIPSQKRHRLVAIVFHV